MASGRPCCRSYCLRPESHGQQTFMTDGDQSSVVEFRFSGRRQLVITVVMLLALVATVVGANAVLNQPWWRGLSLPLLLYVLMVVPSVAFADRHGRQAPHLPVQLTRETLTVTGPNDAH
jgi:hypothetical protein